jgi:hypothetical protein
MHSAAVEPVVPAWLDAFPSLRAVYVDWMSRELVPIDVFNAMTAELKTTAFSAVVTMNDVQRQRLLDGIGKAITDGMTVKEFRDYASPLLENPAYADLVYGMNVGNAARGGQYAEIFGSLGSDYPAWRYYAIRDDRNDQEDECPHIVCRSLDGKVFDKTDPVGWRLLPPNHFQCRCYVGEVNKTEAASSSIFNGSALRADDAFDYDKRSLAPVSF